MLLNFATIRLCKGYKCGVHGHQRWTETQCSVL